MSGETKMRESGWTVDTLKELLEDKLNDLEQYFENKLLEKDLRYQERWEAQEAATTYSQEKANEFRGSLDDLSTKQATKIELDTAINTLNDKIDAVTKDLGLLRSRLDIGNPAIQALQSRIDTITGVNEGHDENWLRIFGIITATGVIVALISKFIH